MKQSAYGNIQFFERKKHTSPYVSSIEMHTHKMKRGAIHVTLELATPLHCSVEPTCFSTDINTNNKENILLFPIHTQLCHIHICAPLVSNQYIERFTQHTFI